MFDLFAYIGSQASMQPTGGWSPAGAALGCGAFSYYYYGLKT